MLYFRPVCQIIHCVLNVCCFVLSCVSFISAPIEYYCVFPVFSVNMHKLDYFEISFPAIMCTNTWMKNLHIVLCKSWCGMYVELDILLHHQLWMAIPVCNHFLFIPWQVYNLLQFLLNQWTRFSTNSVEPMTNGSLLSGMASKVIVNK